MYVYVCVWIYIYMCVCMCVGTASGHMDRHKNREQVSRRMAFEYIRGVLRLPLSCVKSKNRCAFMTELKALRWEMWKKK